MTASATRLPATAPIRYFPEAVHLILRLGAGFLLDIRIRRVHCPQKSPRSETGFRNHRTMIKLDGVAAFVAIADAGSLSEAARRLSLSKSVVSERLVELERSLGARLVQRTTRKMSLTEDGLAFLERARTYHPRHHRGGRRDRRTARRSDWRLRISHRSASGACIWDRRFIRFSTRIPQIQLTLDLEDRFVDVEADGYDAVLRDRPFHDNRLIAKQQTSEPTRSGGVSSLSGDARGTHPPHPVFRRAARHRLPEPRGRLAIPRLGRRDRRPSQSQPTGQPGPDHTGTPLSRAWA